MSQNSTRHEAQVARTEKTREILAVSQQHSGPLPHPDILKGYASINPNYPERIMAMAEANNKASIDHEEYLVKGSIRIQTIGIILSFSLGLCGLIGGIICGILGLSAAAISAIIGGIAPVLIASIGGMAGSKKNGKQAK